ncbi:MAG: 30S ribosomal protein S12 methylthiotransferase RimO [Phycisphaeraceae bacterium]
MPRTKKKPAPLGPPASAGGESSIRTVAFVSLGCPKNLVDSEAMLGQLASAGLIPVSDAPGTIPGTIPGTMPHADAIVINTCGFLEAAKEESLQVIRDAAALKKQGKLKRLIVAGCLVQRHRAKMLEWCPDIDALIGVFDRDHITQAVQGRTTSVVRLGPPASAGGESAHDLDIPGSPLPIYSSIAANATLAKRARNLDDKNFRGYFESDAARLRLTPRHYAYLRISEGCNQNCAFCTIPSIRGKMRSKPPEVILAEAAELFNDGAVELNLIGQDTTSYGNDIAYTPGLPGILTALDRLAASRGHDFHPWLRLMYAYPSCFTDEMIDAIAQLPGVVKYIDMPLQHINDRILTLMRRKTSRKLILRLLNKLRQKVPGVAIRTTFISGFPTETLADHRELVAFLRDFQFDAMGVFPYSPEPGTPAGTLHATSGRRKLSDAAIHARIEELMLTQQSIVFNRNQQLAQQHATFDILIDAPTSGGQAEAERSAASGSYLGRTYAQAPDIDTHVKVQSRHRLSPGELVPCTITAAADYDLIAVPTADLQTPGTSTRLTVLR